MTRSSAAVAPPSSASSLGQTTARGAVWLIAQNAGGRVVGFLAQLVIAAILSPADFGVIGLAYTVSTFGAMLTNYGVESVLLQRQKTLGLWIVPAFWYSFGVGTLGFILVLILGPIAGRIYHMPQVALLAAVIGISIPVTALATIPSVLLRARFQFRAIAGIGLAETLLIQGLTIGLALAGYGALSFALPLPIVAILRTAVVWSLPRPAMAGLFSRIGRVKYLMNSSMVVFCTGVVQSAISQGGYIVLGVLGNEVAVGVYFFAFKLASQPLMLMAISLSNVLFPALSHMRSAPVAQGAAAFRAAKLLGLLIMPMAFLQAAVIEPAMHVFFASKWDASIPLMQILSIALGFDAISWVAGTLVTAQRAFRRQFIYVLSCAPPFFVLVTIGGWNGSALGVALGVAVHYMLVSPTYSYFVFRRCGIGLGSLATIYLRPAAIAALGVAAALGASSALHIHSDLVRIASISAVFSVVYLALLRMADADGFKDAQSLIAQMLIRRISTKSPVSRAGIAG